MMKKSTLISIFLMGIISLNFNLALSQQWKPANFPEASTWTICKTANGNIIAAVDKYPDNNGKLYISKDNAGSWEECNVAGYNYSAYVVVENSVYMGGLFGNIAISHDNGETWTLSNLSEAIGENITDSYPIYAMEYHNERIYASVLYLGIAYSEDWGETWVMTDRESLLLENPEDGGQWCYGLRAYKGKLYNLAAFGIWTYDEDSDLWNMINDAWYNSGAVVHNDILYVNHNAHGIPQAIRYTSDGENWTVMNIPDGLSTSVRVLDFYGDALFIGHVIDGVWYTLDNGETWIDFKDDFPGYSPIPELTFYDCPMGFVFADGNIICSVFSSRGDGLGVIIAPIPDNIVVGIEKQEFDSNVKFTVYPNPTNNLITINIDLNESANVALNITDIHGRTIFSKPVAVASGEYRESVSVKGWAPGLYFYNLQYNNKIYTDKFIVK
ncbi:T9SS type A sorting domain-containing protein [Bacteroidales bacterium OttesenSCG-928-K03]|nr:T9SS type A sorting domain-containing protein [Odoribacter sp. OttesenSCG-928-L07]MDL2239847.1 T9SS type A sorting domain-containing protein [Bacteroidales bacterium OttesenSCG-928-L14]MDL2242444.1 T9SS type A sorting domain-containing protein [Bacteroidales bacterium OttesenSCG-928-K03]